LSENDAIDDELSLKSEIGNQVPDEIGLEFGIDETIAPSSLEDSGDLSEEARKKLMEIDAIMDLDASQINLTTPSQDDLNLDFSSQEENLEEIQETPAMTDTPEEGLNIDGLSFSSDNEAPPKVQKKQEVIS
jgi:hypothetical protein